MARGIASCTLVGRLTRDPEHATMPNGDGLVELGVAVNGSRKDASGQWVDEPSFFDVKVFGQQAAACERYLTKGREVAIDGYLKQRRWEAQDGTKRSKIEVIANTVMFIGGGQSSDDTPPF